MNENVKSFVKEVEANEELRTKIEALEGADNVAEKAIAIAAEYGYVLTEEDLNTVTEEDFKESGNAALSLDDLDSVAGGIPEGLRRIIMDMELRRQMGLRN